MKGGNEVNVSAQSEDRIEPGAHIGPGRRFLLLQKTGEGGMRKAWLTEHSLNPNRSGAGALA